MQSFNINTLINHVPFEKWSFGVRQLVAATSGVEQLCPKEVDIVCLHCASDFNAKGKCAQNVSCRNAFLCLRPLAEHRYNKRVGTQTSN